MYRDNEDFYKLFFTYQLPFAGGQDWAAKVTQGA
jgi:hypothetical protein